MFHERIINKIPGEPSAGRRKQEGQGYIDNLENKQKFELLDLLERQNKLLANKRFVSKLPDRGEKILKFKANIMKEIEHRENVDQAANLMSRLNIASEGKLAMNALEWTGKYNERASDDKVVELDSDDETDPLKILAQPTGTGVHSKKIVKFIPAEASCIEPKDMEEIESYRRETSCDGHTKFIVDIVENPKYDVKKEHFKPYNTTKSNVHDPMKEKVRKKDKHWEVTAATPPLIVHGAAKTLNLQESLKLEQDQAQKLQEIRAKHALERLTQQIGCYSVDKAPKDVGNYRAANEDSDSSSCEDAEEEHEVHDEEDNDKAGTVVFKIDTTEE